MNHDPPSAARSRRAYLVGTNFSGSTVFGQALGAHAEVSYLGEVDRLIQHPASFFAPEPEPPCRYCDLRGAECPVWTQARVEAAKAQPHGRLMDFFEGEFDAPVLVDGSKHPHWLRAAVDQDGLDPGRTVVFLNMRSPFAFCDSYRNRTGCQPWEAANVWRDVYYDSLRLINRLGLPLMIVRYERFALDPEAVLRPACALLGVPYDDRMPFFQEQPSHDVGGNISSHAVPRAQDDAFSSQEFLDRMPAALVGLSQRSQGYWGKPFGGWVDTKWHRNLTGSDVESVLMTPGLADLANLFGYELAGEVAAWERNRESPDVAPAADPGRVGAGSTSAPATD